MRIKFIFIIFIVALLLVGCDNSTEPAGVVTDTGEGYIESDTSADVSKNTESTPETEDVFVKIMCNGVEYWQLRRTLVLYEDDFNMNFTYFGEIKETLAAGTPLTEELTAIGVPKDTPIYMSDDLTCIRTVFGGVIYYCSVREENSTDITDAPGGFPPMFLYDGKLYKHNGLADGGETWEFELDENWRFIGCIRSVVDRSLPPEFDLEANFDYMGLPLYYNDETGRIAILVEDDNYAYSDIDWEIYEPVE